MPKIGIYYNFCYSDLIIVFIFMSPIHPSIPAFMREHKIFSDASFLVSRFVVELLYCAIRYICDVLDRGGKVGQNKYSRKSASKPRETVKASPTLS